MSGLGCQFSPAREIWATDMNIAPGRYAIHAQDGCCIGRSDFTVLPEHDRHITVILKRGRGSASRYSTARCGLRRAALTGTEPRDLRVPPRQAAWAGRQECGKRQVIGNDQRGRFHAPVTRRWSHPTDSLSTGALLAEGRANERYGKCNQARARSSVTFARGATASRVTFPWRNMFY